MLLTPTAIALFIAPQVVQLEPVLEAEIGSDAVGLGNVVDLAADADGSVYVLDNRAGVVRVFSAPGDYLRSFGQAGDRASALSRPTYIDIHASLVTVLNAGGRTNAFDLDGNGLATTSLPFGSLSVTGTGDGSFAVYTSAAISRDDPQPTEHVIVLGPASADTLLTVASSDVLYRSPTGSSTIRTSECRLAYATVGPDREVWVASGIDGTLTEWSRQADGYQPGRSLDVANPASPLPDSASARLVAMLPRQLDPEQGDLDLPELRSSICGLERAGPERWIGLRGDLGRERWIAVDPATLSPTREVVGPEGVSVSAFSGNRVYGVTRDAGGVMHVRVYRLE